MSRSPCGKLGSIVTQSLGCCQDTSLIVVVVVVVVVVPTDIGSEARGSERVLPLVASTHGLHQRLDGGTRRDVKISA